MSDSNFNRDFFVRKIFINKNIEDVYELAATPAGIAKWFIDKAEYCYDDNKFRGDNEPAQPGDKYKFYWLYKDYSADGEVIEAETNKIFKFTFGGAGIVTITLSEENQKTLVELKQENYPGKQYDMDAYINCYVCWTFYLANLKSVMEAGFDMRDREDYLEGFVNK
ncbi:MAG: SRPBCC domain-containing protein [Ignavibacteriae bacterium]|nr:MAG: SRPBCC domain-containing protein [Ignavibacteriota bacterium]